MYEPRSTGVTVAGSRVATICPRRITSSVSERPISSSRSAESKQHRQARPARLPDALPHGGLRADVDAARRVRRDEQLGLGEHLPTHDELLLVAARERVRGDVDARRAHIEVVDDLLGALARTTTVDPAATRVGRLGLMAEHAVLPERRREQQAVMLAVLGDVPDSVLSPESCARVRDVDAGERDAAARRLTEADERLDELALPVAFDSRDADHLAAVDGERHVIEHRAHVLDDGEPCDVEHRPCR